MFDESLSALIDGELAPAEAQHLLERIKRDPALREAWTRQHLLRAALRRQVRRPGVEGVADRVAARLQTETVTGKVVDLTSRLRAPPEPAAPRQKIARAEPPAEAPVRKAMLSTRRQLAYGLAAAMALVALLVPLLSGSQQAAPAATRIAADKPLTWSGVNPETAQELNGYLLDHHSAAGYNLASVPANARLATAGLQDAAYER